jgi:adenylate cyclase
VNVASRAEAACKEVGYDLVVAGSTAETVSEFAIVEAGRIRLKGKDEPVVLMILVGGAEVKASPQFIEFSQRYRLLIEALRDGRGADTENAMADCRSLAARLDPHLMQFLDRIPHRLDDFRPMPKSRIRLVSGVGDRSGVDRVGQERRGGECCRRARIDDDAQLSRVLAGAIIPIR